MPRLSKTILSKVRLKLAGGKEGREFSLGHISGTAFDNTAPLPRQLPRPKGAVIMLSILKGSSQK